jgi:hypothetical protein
MSRHWLLFYLVSGLSLAAHAQPEPFAKPRSSTPAWLPRGASLGSYQPFGHRRSHEASRCLGGLLVGLFADWR